jgi:GT2 family glycosyltransferase
MPQVSIIIINYNTHALTCKCINSVYAHTQDIEFEIILVDNASTETNTVSFTTLFPNINFVQSPINLGFAKGNNLGIAHAKGDVILLLNSDTELVENTVKLCYNELLNDKKTAALTCKLLYPNGTVQHNAQAFPSITKKTIEKLRLHKLLPKTLQAKYLQGFYWDYNTSGYPNWIWGTFFMFDKKLLQQLPNQQLNDAYFMYMEDMQWCLDFYKINLRCKYIATTHIIHHCGASSKGINPHLTHNYALFLQKNYSAIEQFFLLKI